MNNPEKVTFFKDTTVDVVPGDDPGTVQIKISTSDPILVEKFKEMQKEEK